MAATVGTIVTGARGLLDRVFPRGAILLSFLSLGYFATGIIRNRVFANTYGAGAELDAYNAAFRIPEIALDVLVAAGLTAPFVPIYSRLRHDDGDEPANDFGRTVLTGAVGLMSIASIGIFIAAPWLAGVIAEGFDPATQDLYVQLLRINCLAQVMFAASIALGEILVAHRRFLFYALAPILYTTGIIVGTVLFAARFGIVASAWGAVGGAAAHLAIRAIGTSRTSFRIRPAFVVRTAAFREFLRLMVPRMFSVAIDPLTITYFTRVAAGLGVGAVSALNFGLDYQVLPVSLIGVSFSLAVFPLLSAAYADGDRSIVQRHPDQEPGDDRDPDRPGRGGPVRVVGDARARASRRRQVHRGRRGGHLVRRRGVRAVGPVRRPRLPALARAVRDARHPAPGPRLVRRPRRGRPRHDAARPGVRDPRHPPRLRGRGDRQGRPARAVPRAAGPAHRRQPGGLTGIVGRTVMYRPSRAGYLPSGRFHGRKFRIISALFWNVPGGSDGPQMLETSGYHGSWM